MSEAALETTSPMEFSNPSDAEIREILTHPTTVAVIGCSVSPQLTADALMPALGERCYPDLASIPGPVEMVDVFRRPEYLPEITKAAIAKGARVLWCQLGVVNLEGAARARAAGMAGVMDRCPAIEYGRLF